MTPPDHIQSIGLIAGNGVFPLRFAVEAKRNNCRVYAVCFEGETDPQISEFVEEATWTKVGELGRLIKSFRNAQVSHAAMAGGINRVKLFGGVKLDARGAALLLKLRSSKDDVIMRGIADELSREGIEVVSSTIFLNDCLAKLGQLTRSKPSADELEDIRVGTEAIRAMSGQHIGQLVVVREGVVVAVEAVEGSDRAIRRGGELGGKGSVVVKFAKPDQDMRFDVPMIGVKTIETMAEVGARVLAVEAGRCLILDEEEVFALANKRKIAIIGCPPLAEDLP